MSSQQKQPLDSDEPIWDAARRMLKAGGERAVSMDGLAAACGISRATLYRRLGGRSLILKRLAAEPGAPDLAIDLDATIRSRILQAARAAVSASGSINITVEQVAAQAGLGVATVYRHFGTKKILLCSMAEQLPIRTFARELLNPASSAIQTDLQQFAENLLRFGQTDSVFIRLLLTGDTKAQQLFGAVRNPPQDRTFNTVTSYFAAQIDAGRLSAGDPQNLASAFVGMLLGFAFVKPSHTHTQDDPAEVAAFVVQIFLSGAGYVHTE